MSSVAYNVRLFHKLWSNGERPLILAALFAVGSSAFLTGVILISIFFKPSPFEPLENISPQHVTTPVVFSGATVSIEAVKCNNTSKDVGVEGRSYWREKHTNKLVPYLNGIGVRAPGCANLSYVNQLPMLEPGTWRLEGIDVARSGSKVQQEPWTSEWFTVLGSDE